MTWLWVVPTALILSSLWIFAWVAIMRLVMVFAMDSGKWWGFPLWMAVWIPSVAVAFAGLFAIGITAFYILGLAQ